MLVAQESPSTAWRITCTVSILNEDVTKNLFNRETSRMSRHFPPGLGRRKTTLKKAKSSNPMTSITCFSSKVIIISFSTFPFSDESPYEGMSVSGQHVESKDRASCSAPCANGSRYPRFNHRAMRFDAPIVRHAFQKKRKRPPTGIFA